MLRSSVILASLLFSPANVIVPNSGDVVIPPKAIEQVVCFSREYISAGTAFRVGDGLLLSANHVTSEPNCYIAGKPIGHVWKSPSSDFSMIDGDEGPSLKIDCGGFVKGAHYVAIGFARGLATLTEVDLIGTGLKSHGEAVLEGVFAVVPGMSGGAIVDADTGSVVGIVDAENFEAGLSLSEQLKDTPLCKKASA